VIDRDHHSGQDERGPYCSQSGWGRFGGVSARVRMGELNARMTCGAARR
jgi:hypothetical protein